MEWQMKNSTHTSFDDLPDVALIQIRPLMNFKVVPYSATTIWRKCRIGQFPAPIKISAGITGWRVSEIRQWLVDPAGYGAGEKEGAK
jgi:predicted DNA-binding transcriptional regulator AlpA